MIPAWLADAAEEFWRRVGGERPFPRDLGPVASLGLPLTVVPLESLSIRMVDTWLTRRGGNYQFLCSDRALRGCVIASRGVGAIFMDPSDSQDDRRYTVAHEIAHIVLDYLYPREQALAAFGEVIRHVLDGDRAPTPSERIDARLAEVPLGSYVNLLPRTAKGQIWNSSVLRSEERADRLALELLAPLEVVEQHLTQPHGGRDVFLVTATEMLRTVFGLPDRAAHEYAERLGSRLGAPSTRQWLGL